MRLTLCECFCEILDVFYSKFCRIRGFVRIEYSFNHDGFTFLRESKRWSWLYVIRVFNPVACTTTCFGDFESQCLEIPRRTEGFQVNQSAPILSDLKSRSLSQ